jgi:hypothetical protein
VSSRRFTSCASYEPDRRAPARTRNGFLGATAGRNVIASLKFHSDGLPVAWELLREPARDERTRRCKSAIAALRASLCRRRARNANRRDRHRPAWARLLLPEGRMPYEPTRSSAAFSAAPKKADAWPSSSWDSSSGSVMRATRTGATRKTNRFGKKLRPAGGASSPRWAQVFRLPSRAIGQGTSNRASHRMTVCCGGQSAIACGHAHVRSVCVGLRGRCD